MYHQNSLFSFNLDEFDCPKQIVMHIIHIIYLDQPIKLKVQTIHLTKIYKPINLHVQVEKKNLVCKKKKQIQTGENPLLRKAKLC